MKILICFIDMLRGKEELQNLKYKNMLKNIGGIYYSNAFALSGDTFRSFSTIITGLYPKENGCTHSAYVPETFLKNKMTIFNYLLNKNFKIYMKINPFFSNISMFPRILNECFLFNDIDEIIDNYKKDISKNKLFFYYDEDYHELICNQSNKKQEIKARNKIIENLDYLFSKLNNKEFDKVIIFSDHGCTLYEDNEETNYNINDCRNKITLLVRENKNEEFCIKDHLVSTLDIFPTFLSWFKEPILKMRGKNVADTTYRKFYIEDGYCDYMGFDFGYKLLKRMYKIKIKSTNTLDKIYTYKDLLKLEDEKEINFMNEYLVQFSKIVTLEKIHKLIVEKKIYRLPNFKINMEFFDSENRLQKYNDKTIIQKKDYYGRKSFYFKVISKISFIRKKYFNLLRVREND